MSKPLIQKDYNLLTQLMQADEDRLLGSLYNILSKKYKDITVTKEYLYAAGTDPVCLVAHVDTVFNSPPTDIFYDTNKNVMWSPQGLGADDRVGIFIILKIIESGYKPSIIFTTGEEMGGIGATKFANTFEKPVIKTKFLVEFDRHGDKDCVFYHCGNKDFHDYIEKYGFEKAYGTFSDISVICPKWDIAGVNLSVGYEDEHSYTEYLKIGIMMNTIEKAKKIIKESKDAPSFNYKAETYIYNNTSTNKSYVCYECMSIFPQYGGIDYVTKEGKIRHICDSCFSVMAEDVDWCSFCYQPYEKVEGKDHNCCPICAKEDKNV